MNRHDRRTKGKAILQRLTVLRNSPILKEADLSDLPKEVVDLLVAGNHPSKEMQRRYNTCKRILDEMMKLELDLKIMQYDLEAKRKAK